jgi:adenine-specific DNA-methyltransferase
MPTLEWIGKDKVINHHLDVPYRVLDHKYTYLGNGKTGAEIADGNKIIRGDNLEALKALLPQYEGKIKCIYIDPPYNTGNEGWVYNDNVNDPKIKKWLGEVVGKEEDDLSRHDKWLCMIYPRLKLLHRLLSQNGAIFISLDDNELFHLRALMNEIFGANNFIAQITLLCNPKGRSQDKYFATNHEYLLVYSKSQLPSGAFSVSKGEEKLAKDYKLEDNNGKYRLLELRNTHREFGKFNRPNLWYPIYVNAETGDVSLSPSPLYSMEVYPVWPNGFEGCWTWGKELANKDIALLKAQQKSGSWKIYRKAYAMTQDGETAKQKLFTIWSDPLFYTEKGQIAFGKIFPGKDKTDFPQPKSVNYIKQIITTITSGDDIILDSFAGSGTTAHAVLNMNKADGGNRKFILVEMMDYAESITAERVRRVIDGYADVEGTGGNFSFYELGEPLLNNDQTLNEKVPTEKIRQYVFFMETKQPIGSASADEPYLLGIHVNSAYYFYYEKECITSLNHEFLATVRTQAEGYVIYADLCMLSDEELREFRITFKKIPRDISRL